MQPASTLSARLKKSSMIETAQADNPSAPWPNPGTSTSWDLGSVLAALSASLGGVTASSVPFIIRTGISLLGGSWTDVSALPTSQISHSSKSRGSCGNSGSTLFGNAGSAIPGPDVVDHRRYAVRLYLAEYSAAQHDSPECNRRSPRLG